MGVEWNGIDPFHVRKMDEVEVEWFGERKSIICT